MDPFQMPQWFCVAQTITIGLGSLLLASVCTSFTVATFRAIYRPFEIRKLGILRFRPFYWWIVGVFPVCASIVQIIVIVKLDAVKPSDDIHCDASDPIWFDLST
jgi:hypothetical protein